MCDSNLIITVLPKKILNNVMKTVTTKAIAKVAAVATGLAMASSMLSFAPMAHAAALTSTQISSIISLLQSFGADAATVANVQASLTGGTPSVPSTPSTPSSACSFTKDLKIGSSGLDVTCLQQALIASSYAIPAGATGHFGPQTQAAVIAWQKAAGITPAAGYFGSKSRAAFNLGGSTGGTTGGTGGTTTPTGTGLKVSLSPTSPNGTVLVATQGIGDLADFTFTNPTASSINVTNLTFKRIGVSNDSALLNVYLYNGGTRISDSASVSAGAFSYSNSNGIFAVPAGGTYTVSVRSDIASGTSGQQIGVQLVSATSSGTLDSSVVFPISGGLQTVSAANLASVVFQAAAATLPTTNPSLTPANDITIWQNSVSVSTNPVNLKSIRFTNLGSIDSANVINLRLYVDGAQVGSTVPVMGADRSVTFDLSANPLSLSTQNHVIKVLANITGGSSRTLAFSVQRSSDAMFVDSQLGQPVMLNTTSIGTTFSAATAGTQTIAAVTASSGVSVSLDPSSPSANIATGATSVKFATFAFLASGEDVKVQDLYVVASSSVSGVISGVGGLNNGKIFVNGVQIGSTKDINAGTSASAVGSATDFALGSSLILPAGQTVKVDIYGDAQDTAGTNLTSGASVIVSLIAGSSNGQGQSSLVSTNVPATTVSTNAVTVTTSTLSATKYTGYGAQTVIAGTNNAKLGSFTLSTGSTEGVNVNTIVVTMSGANAASITNLTLKDSATGTQIGSVITTPSLSNSYSVNFAIPASGSKTIDIFGNVLSSANGGPIVLNIGTATAGTGLVTNISTSPASSASLQIITVATSGTLTLTRGAGDPVSNNVLAGASSVKVGQFNFAAQSSSYTVQNLAILIPNNVATSTTGITLSYKDANGATQTVTQPVITDSTKGTATATFTGLTMYVPMNDSANLDVFVGTPTIASGATSGAPIQVTLDAGGTGGTVFRAVDSAGGQLTVVNSGTDLASAGTFYVRKSIPTLAITSGQGGNFVPANPIYKFTMTADAAGAIDWSKIVFNVATTSTTLTNVYLVDDATGNSITDSSGGNQYASTTATTVTLNLNYNTTAAQYQQIAGGATKTYDLYGTVGSFGTGASLSISLASESGSAPAANGTVSSAGTPSGNFIWSDRSASPHTPPSVGVTSSGDFTNGYLLKNFTTTSVSYSK